MTATLTVLDTVAIAYAYAVVYAAFTAGLLMLLPAVRRRAVHRLAGRVRRAFREWEASVRAETLRDAADFVRDAHFTDGLTVQEIGVALRRMADRAGDDRG
jgi:hypothetical protein